MNNEQEKSDEEIIPEKQRKEQVEKEAEYARLRTGYGELSLRFLRVSYIFAGSLFILMLILLVMSKLSNESLLTGAQYFFLFVSFIAFCISIALHLRYRSLLNDPLSELSGQIVLFAQSKNQTLSQRIAKNRKIVYNNNTFFWIGVFSFLLVILLGLIPGGCDDKHDRTSFQTRKNDGKLAVDLLQVNDVYEISPLDSDRIGGMARVATLKKQFQHQNQNTLLLMAGDFLSPSVFNSVKNAAGERIAGKQMISAMNVAGVDLATFGNHEFDISYSVLQQRINESGFQWVASNVYHKTASGNILFQKNNTDIPKTWVKTFVNHNGVAFTIGFFGLTTPDNKGGDPEYVAYDSTINAANSVYKDLATRCDVVIAITHQDLRQDSMLAVAIPQLAAIIGGHEHDMQFEKVGNVYISKAHSNAKTAFHVRLLIERNNNICTTVVIPELVPLDTSIEQDYLTKAICERWMDSAVDFFKKSGFSPSKSVCNNFNGMLDGRDSKIRNGPTNLTRLITDAMLWAARPDGCEISILNAGSIRVDDIITPEITEYSILRALPYGGSIRIAEMKGWFIKKLITAGLLLKNDGGFVQYSDNLDTNPWSIDKIPVSDSGSYKVAIANYLITGQQSKLEFIKEGTAGIVSVDAATSPGDSTLYDVRKAVIKYLEKYCNDKNVIAKYR